MLGELARLLNSRADVEAAFDDVLRLVTELLGLRTAWLFQLQPPGRRLAFRAAFGLPPALEAEGRRLLLQGRCTCFHLFSRGRLREAVNVVECSRLQEAEGDRCGLVYHASVPLRSSGGVLGVLNVAAPGESLFDEAALNLLTAVGEHLGTALERSRLFSQERRRAAAFQAVDRIVRALAEPEGEAAPPPEAVAQRFAQACVQELGAGAVLVAVADADRGDGEGGLQEGGGGLPRPGLKLLAVAPGPGGEAPKSAAWRAGAPVPRRSLLWASWDSGRAYFVPGSAGPGPAGAAEARSRRPSRAVVPVILGRRRLGAVLLERDGDRPWLAPEEPALRSLADHLALALENARLAQRARDLVRAEERHRLSRDLHDAVSQNLFSLSMLLAGGREHLQAGRVAQATEALAHAQERARVALAEMRRLVQDLRPRGAGGPRTVGELVEELSRLAAAHPLADQLGVAVRLRLGRLDRSAPLGPDGAQALVRVAQEAVHNALKHGAPHRVTLWLGEQAAGTLQLVIRDDGRGFDPRRAHAGAGRGLSIMEERCRLAGGALKVESRPGRGTRVTARVPLPADRGGRRQGGGG